MGLLACLFDVLSRDVDDACDAAVHKAVRVHKWSVGQFVSRLLDAWSGYFVPVYVLVYVPVYVCKCTVLYCTVQCMGSVSVCVHLCIMSVRSECNV